MINDFLNLKSVILILISILITYIQYRHKYYLDTENQSGMNTPCFSSMLFMMLFMIVYDPKGSLFLMANSFQDKGSLHQQIDILFNTSKYLKAINGTSIQYPLNFSLYKIPMFVIIPILIMITYAICVNLIHNTICLRKVEIRSNLIQYAVYFIIVCIAKYKIFMLLLSVHGIAILVLSLWLHFYSKYSKCPLL